MVAGARQHALLEAAREAVKAELAKHAAWPCGHGS